MSIIYRLDTAAKIRRYNCVLWVLYVGCFAVPAGAQTQMSNSPTFQFEGSKVFGNQKLVEITNKCLSEHSAPAIQDEAVIDYCLHRAKSFMAAKGYLQATLGTPTRMRTEGVLTLKVRVQEGALYRLQDLRISGSVVFPEAQLRQMLNLKSGDIADAEAINRWLFESVKKAYGQLGYIQYTAEVDPLYHLEEGATEGAVGLTVTIDEGRRFYVHSITFDGNADIPQDLLLANMLLSSGEPFNSELLSESLKRIDQTKQFQTIDSDKDVDYRSKQDSNQLDITIHLKKKQ